MHGQSPAELVLGSVQLGLEYGAANKTGKPSHDAALRLVRRAVESGIRAFDTARAYGDSEARLGEALASSKPVRMITKLSPLPDLSERPTRGAVWSAVDASIAQSLFALRRQTLDCLLLHRASHMMAYGGAIWERLLELRHRGTIAALGVSVQSPDEAFTALACADVVHIQLPFNVLDWRWREAGVTDAIARRPDVTVHARSVFLQGILVANDDAVWPKLHGVDSAAFRAALSDGAEAFGRETVADLCLAYVRGQCWVDGVVIGMETQSQLDANLRLSARWPLAQADCRKLEAMLPRAPEPLLDPALWPPSA